MRKMIRLGIGVVLLLMPAISRADQTVVDATDLPIAKIAQKQPLDEVLVYIQQAVPDFHYTVFRGEGVPSDYPRLPAMKLEGVSIGQFLTLISNEYPRVKITEIGGGKQPLYTIDIAAAPADPPEKAATNPAPATTQPAGDPVVVRVMGLNSIVDARVFGTKDRRQQEDQAVHDVLSLVQATLEASDPDHLPTLKVHQATRTLIVRGTAAQADAVAAVLAVLEPSLDKRIANSDELVSERNFAEQEKNEAIISRRATEGDLKREQAANEELRTNMKTHDEIWKRQCDAMAKELQTLRATQPGGGGFAPPGMGAPGVGAPGGGMPGAAATTPATPAAK